MSSAVIVGAEVFGASMAWRLASDGWDVRLIDRFEPGHVRASSGGESRLIRLGPRLGGPGGSGHGFKHGPARAEQLTGVINGERAAEPLFAAGLRAPGDAPTIGPHH